MKNYLFNKKIALYSSTILIAYFLLLLLLPIKDCLLCARWILGCAAIGFISKMFFQCLGLNFKHITVINISLGIAIFFFSTWILGAVFNIAYDYALFYLLLIVFILAVCLISKKKKIKPEISDINYLSLVLFIVVFFICAYFISFRGDLRFDTEKYMDFGILNSVFNQRKAIPNDMWFMGERINYYYLGQACISYLCKLFFISPEYGYNLGICTISALTFSSVFELVTYLLNNLFKNKDINKLHITLSSIISACLVCFGSNGHWLLYGVFKPLINKIKGIGSVAYWYPDCISFININNGEMDIGRTEMPAYSFMVGDLHAHFINLIFVVAVLFLIVYYFVNYGDKQLEKKVLILISIFLALFKGTNYWDYVIYLVIMTLEIIFLEFASNEFIKNKLLNTFKKILIVILISHIVSLPFSMNFEQISSKICLVGNYTSITKLLVIWLYLIIPSLILLIYIFISREIFNNLKTGLFVLICCALGLILVPEILYVKDIYGLNYARFNTMFKLTYQSYVNLSILYGVCVYVLLSLKLDNKYLNIIKKSLTSLIIFLALLSSSYYFINEYNLIKDKESIGLSCLESLKNNTEYKEYFEVADIICEDDASKINIIESCGFSYSEHNLLSVITGASDVIGWHTHEYLWRNDVSLVNNRFDEVRKFYEAGNEKYCKEIIDKYKIKYIYVGKNELNDYSINIDGFKNISEVIWGKEVKEHHYYLFKVN